MFAWFVVLAISLCYIVLNSCYYLPGGLIMSARRKVKYREEYTEQFPSIKRGRTEYEAFCKICG